MELLSNGGCLLAAVRNMQEQPPRPEIDRPIDPVDTPPPDIKPVPPPDIPAPSSPPGIPRPGRPERGGESLPTAM
jgi:hypothetical protein